MPHAARQLSRRAGEGTDQADAAEGGRPLVHTPAPHPVRDQAPQVGRRRPLRHPASRPDSGDVAHQGT